MKFRFLLIVLFLTLLNTLSFAAQIVTNNLPIASLVKMLVLDSHTVDSIVKDQGCPLHYQASFADLKKIKEADLIIYIDDEFDKFISKTRGQKNNFIKISEFKNLNIIKNQLFINWHIWLDLDNAKFILKNLAPILSDKLPDSAIQIESNLTSALDKIKDLQNLKNQKLSYIKEIILADDNLEYIFASKDYNILKLFEYNKKNFKYLKLLKSLEQAKDKRCILIDTGESSKLYEKYNLKIVKVNSENWSKKNNLETLFYDNYLEVIDNISNGCR